jgi:branched-chain amino acid transport system substrate-binding protein
MRRCRKLHTALLALACVLFVGPGDLAPAQTIKIGLINSNTGFLAQQGDQMDKGIRLSVKTHEKDLPPGVKVELIRRDDTAAAEVGKRMAQELITRERV